MIVEICKLDRNRNLDKTNIYWLVQAIGSFSRIPISTINSFELGNASSAFSSYALAAEDKNSDYSTQYLFDTNILAPKNRAELNKILAKNAKKRKKGTDDSDEEATKEGNKNSATLASMCRNIGLLEDYQGSIRLTSFAKCLFITDRVLAEEYVFALLAKQWVKVDGICKRPLLCIIYDLCLESNEFLDKLQNENEAAKIIAKSIVGHDVEDKDLKGAKMDILKNHLLLSGLFTCAPNKQILLTPEGRVILKLFREKEEFIPKYSNDDFLEYIGRIDNGAFAAIDRSNASTFSLLYPNLVRIILKLKTNMIMDTFSGITPIILYGPPGTGKTHKMQAEYISSYDKDNRFVTTFHQSFSYEEFVEGLKPVLITDEKEEEKAEKKNAQEDSSGDVNYRIVKGIFRKACNRAAQLANYKSLKECVEDTFENRQKMFSQAIKENKTVLLCIDEINRGNIAAIFGDLISLIEDNKRLGVNEQTEMIVTLPYSQDLFGVPANLLIVGTMNTADRSIQLLDSALRRRFRFEELLPDYDVFNVPENNEHYEFKKTAKEILISINARIRCLLNKDYQIGHSYLMNVTSFKDIFFAVVCKMIPLLEEYFYNEIDKVRFVLNELGSPKNDYDFYKVDDDAISAFDLYKDSNIDSDDKTFYKLSYEIKNEEDYYNYLKHLYKNSEE